MKFILFLLDVPIDTSHSHGTDSNKVARLNLKMNLLDCLKNVFRSRFFNKGITIDSSSRGIQNADLNSTRPKKPIIMTV